MKENPLKISNYRRDIDGLRAFAIIPVVLFHYFPSWFPGGYTGVDVFFVISGYLITGIIAKEILDQKFSLIDFYSRRAKRIFPTLALVLLSVLAIGYYVLLPDEYVSLGAHTFSGAAFLANLRLLREAGYFDAAAELKPLLHLWSLSIEEQFYLVWPLLLLGVLKLKRPLAWVGAFITISFAANVFLVHKRPELAFYSPPTRFWELFLGCALALYEKVSVPRSNTSELRSNLLGGIGLTLILVPIWLLDDSIAYPGFGALLPVMGAVFVISAGNGCWVNRNLIGNAFLVGVGLISYALYLWHWPLLSLARLTESGMPEISVRVGLLASSVLFACATYFLLERPIRTSRYGLRKFAVYASLIIFMAGLAGRHVRKGQGFPNRLNMQAVETYDRDKRFTESCKRQLGHLFVPAFDEERDFCFWSERKDTPKIAFIGDSHANRLFLGFRSISVPGYEFVQVGRGSCLPFFGMDAMTKRGHPLKCQPSEDQILEYVLNDPTVKIVIFNGFYGRFFNGKFDPLDREGKRVEPQSLERNIEVTVWKYLQSGKKVLMALDVPELELDSKGCRPRPFRITATQVSSRCFFPKSLHLRNASYYEPHIRNALSAFKNVRFFDPAEYLCPGDVCRGVNPEGQPLYIDGHHISSAGSAVLLKAFENLILEMSEI